MLNKITMLQLSTVVECVLPNSMILPIEEHKV